jgi:hypothetical protein
MLRARGRRNVQRDEFARLTRPLSLCSPDSRLPGMATVTDRDGKSKTASAVDAKHYPEQNEVSEEHPLVSDGPDIEEIKLRAYQLWTERGSPHGSADEDWHRAERELRAKNGSERISDKLQESSGSVQR